MNSFWDFFWFSLSLFLMIAYLMVLFNVLIDLFRDKEVSGGMKAVWVFFLIFLPALTALVYLIVRGGGMAERSMAQMQQAKADTDAYIREVAAASPTDQIAQAHQLLSSGAITQQEFDAIKAKALA
ncbi:SHOCT domain-containing protein [Nocardioides sp.]|uniref:SHOCT domain-containing protein n=1 Tax=Nocardioides sp. TaxID=35761 RepID=UPI003528CB5A